MPNCSRCGCSMPLNPPNGVKLTEEHFHTYEIEHAIIKNCAESKPYGALCPECYVKIFSGLSRYRDRTSTKTIVDKPDSFTISTADYFKQEPITINADRR